LSAEDTANYETISKVFIPKHLVKQKLLLLIALARCPPPNNKIFIK